MGAEILAEGEVRVTREDREELLEIRGGAWSYDQVVEHAEELRERMKELRASSSLPGECDEAAAGALCVELIISVLRGEK